ncbi:hypothetical protein [Thermodesulfovibrio yellowstonii]|uniref:hypothetical protein n=1 Tax=Thermodesulfovibrio yellowstonii TaxID=28262 RepID=UPI0004064695|nr:hypothetical protein [Thermodesulfovibrio islandicus]
MILPYPVIYLTNSVILNYLVSADANYTVKGKDYNFVYDESMEDVVCVFSNEFAFPVRLLPEDLQEGYKIHFMTYTMFDPVASFLYTFQVDKDFIIELKAYLKFIEMSKQNAKVSASSEVTN